jgi:hypothetical protein
MVFGSISQASKLISAGSMELAGAAGSAERGMRLSGHAGSSTDDGAFRRPKDRCFSTSTIRGGPSARAVGGGRQTCRRQRENDQVMENPCTRNGCSSGISISAVAMLCGNLVIVCEASHRGDAQTARLSEIARPACLWSRTYKQLAGLLAARPCCRLKNGTAVFLLYRLVYEGV